MHKRVLIVVGVALLAFAAVAAACNSTSDLKKRVETLEQQQTPMSNQAQNTGIVLALTALSAAGIHEFTTSVDAGTLPPGETGPIQRALAAISVAQWPPDLQSVAKDMQTKLSDLLTALATGDIMQVKGPADAAHQLNDSFPSAVYAKVAGSLGLPTPAGGGGGGTPMGTPAMNEHAATATLMP